MRITAEVEVPSMPQTKNYQEISVPWPTFATRPATAEEIEEFHKHIFRVFSIMRDKKIRVDERGWYFRTKEGNRLRLRKR